MAPWSKKKLEKLEKEKKEEEDKVIKLTAQLAARDAEHKMLEQNQAVLEKKLDEFLRKEEAEEEARRAEEKKKEEEETRTLRTDAERLVYIQQNLVKLPLQTQRAIIELEMLRLNSIAPSTPSHSSGLFKTPRQKKIDVITLPSSSRRPTVRELNSTITDEEPDEQSKALLKIKFDIFDQDFIVSTDFEELNKRFYKQAFFDFVKKDIKKHGMWKPYLNMDNEIWNGAKEAFLPFIREKNGDSIFGDLSIVDSEGERSIAESQD